VFQILDTFPDKKYTIIYTDPPWRFETWSDKGKQKAPEQHYKTLSLNDLKKLPVQTISDKNCALFIWTTSSMLEKTFEIIKAWDFKYKSIAFNWYKESSTGDMSFGLGFWTRLNTELCLLATKGSPKRKATNVEQAVFSKLKEHSRKPDEVRARIVRLIGDVPRIELFARHRFEGWDVWGLEAPRQIQKMLKEE
jgi:N6-adenosine-specific RNA methylase IME4